MAHPEGFEPPTPRFEAWCSIQLSYGCADVLSDTISTGSGQDPVHSAEEKTGPEPPSASFSGCLVLSFRPWH